MKQPLWKWKVLTFLLLILFSCQKDDALKPEEASHPHPEHHHIQKVSSQDIPKVMDFIKGKNNGELRFKIQTSNLEGVQNKRSEPDLILTDLETENILALTDEAGRTNYSFQLTFENAPQYEGEVSIFNLIVKEINTEEGFYAYIQEYRVDETWFASEGSTINMTTYTGKMIFYNLDGVYVAKVEFIDGVIIDDHLRSPCPDPDDPTNGDPNPGGGGNSGPGPGGDGGGSTGGTGGGTGGSGDLTMILVPCSCCNCHYVNSPPGTNCICESIGGLPPMIIISQKIYSEDGKINEYLRTACGPAPEPCVDENDDPCTCNIDGTGCVDENPYTPINIITQGNDCVILKAILANASVNSKISELQGELNHPKEKGFNLYLNSNSEINSSPIVEGGVNSFNYSPSVNVFGGVHMHHNGTFPMFSMEDIPTLYKFWNNFDNGSQPNTSLATHIMISSFGVYAIKIDDIGLLGVFFDAMSVNSNYKKHSRKLKTVYKNLDNLSGSQSDFEKKFLELFSVNLNSGISLYRANNSLDNWSKIVLDANGILDDSEDCP